MVHPVKILNFDPSGTVRFELGGTVYTASHTMPRQDASDLLKPGASYPLELGVLCEAEAQYLSGPDETFTRIAESGKGDRVRACGRVSDYMDHDAIRLDGSLSVGEKLRAPQQATDYRRGSWLKAEGILSAKLPSDDHDETGLRQ